MVFIARRRSLRSCLHSKPINPSEHGPPFRTAPRRQRCGAHSRRIWLAIGCLRRQLRHARSPQPKFPTPQRAPARKNADASVAVAPKAMRELSGLLAREPYTTRKGYKTENGKEPEKRGRDRKIVCDRKEHQKR